MNGPLQSLRSLVLRCEFESLYAPILTEDSSLESFRLLTFFRRVPVRVAVLRRELTFNRQGQAQSLRELRVSAPPLSLLFH